MTYEAWMEEIEEIINDGDTPIAVVDAWSPDDDVWLDLYEAEYTPANAVAEYKRLCLPYL